MDKANLEKLLEKFKKAYQKKKHKRVVCLGKKVLEKCPENIEAQKIVRESQVLYVFQQGKRWSCFSWAVILFMLLVSGGFTYQHFFIFPQYTKQQEEQGKKYISLVKENGQIKEENNSLFQQIKTMKEQVSLVSTGFYKIANKLQRKRDTSQDEKKMISQLEGKIKEQENQIKQLANFSITQATQASNLQYGKDVLNFLILGKNGGLTDTILITSINPSLQTMTLISIPRDLYIEGRKVNQIYRDFGVDTLIVYINDITGLNIDHYAVINFIGFEKIIDIVGGIDLDVPKNIEDKRYPTPDGKTEIFKIDKGWQHLDGKTALKYARTRHGDSDFERAKRQQKVIEAIMDKWNSLGIQDAGKMIEMGNSVLSAIQSDINIFQALGLYEKYKDFTVEGNNVLSTSNYLYSSKTLQGTYIALPNDRTYGEIKKWVYGLVME